MDSGEEEGASQGIPWSLPSRGECQVSLGSPKVLVWVVSARKGRQALDSFFQR